MNLRISLTVATLAASLALPVASPAATFSATKVLATAAAKQKQAVALHLAKKKWKRHITINRKVTWHFQDLAGMKRSRARTIGWDYSVPLMRGIVHLWHNRAYHAMRVYHRQQVRASTPTHVYGGSARSIGQAMAANYGWVGSEWAALDELWGSHESGWSTTAHNPGSSACGIPQAMNDCSYGYDPATQIAWGLSYIKGRYKTPSRALAHWYAVSWY